MRDPDDLIGVVSADLAFLHDELCKDIDTDALRRISPVFRRLLVDNDLGRAWRLAGFEKQPRIEASRLLPVVTPGVTTAFRSASEIDRQDFFMSGFGMVIANSPEAGMKALREMSSGPHTFTLTEFMASHCLEFDGKLISRHKVVKYVANKLGGDHHDRKRGNDDENRLFATMDRLLRDARHTVLGLPMPYVELLSIGQAIANAPDIQRLWKRG